MRQVPQSLNCAVYIQLIHLRDGTIIQNILLKIWASYGWTNRMVQCYIMFTTREQKFLPDSRTVKTDWSWHK
jgi:hypothetical protein